MDVAARVTSNGQVTVPKAVREALGIEDGDEIVFRVEGKPAVVARTSDFRGTSPQTAMSAFVDTNVLVRHLTGTPTDKAARATRYLRDEPDLMVTDLVVAETVYVLESFYEASRLEIAEAVRSLLAFESVVTVDSPLLLRAIEVYESDRLDFAEAYQVACAESTGSTRLCPSTGPSIGCKPLSGSNLASNDPATGPGRSCSATL